MDILTITDWADRSFPFSRELFEDPHVMYHGTWSTYTQRIESAGFGGYTLPFDHTDVKTIMLALERAGNLGSYARAVFFGTASDRPRTELSMTGNFWHARAYATDGGGEVVRMLLKEARDFESLCTEDKKRLALTAYWEAGLKKCPGHTLTQKAVEFLADRDALQAECQKVAIARHRIENVVHGGFPVVYAISVESRWFGDAWERYLAHWEEGDRAAVELRCPRDVVSSDRIIAKAIYPNGTDPDFLLDGIRTWADVEAVSRGQFDAITAFTDEAAGNGAVTPKETGIRPLKRRGRKQNL